MADPTAPTSTVDQDALDRALFQTLIIAACVGVAFAIIWAFLRHWAPRLFAPHLFKEGEKGKKFVSFWSWLVPMFTVSDEFLFEHRGLDTLMYSAFSRMMLSLMIVFFFFGILILWPVDGTSSNRNLAQSDPQYVNGTAVLTMSNISTDRSAPEFRRYAAHLISVVFNSLMCYWLFIRTYNIYHRFSVRKWHKNDFSNYAVLLDNISSAVSEEQITEIYDQHFPGQVLSVHRMMGAHDLQMAYLDLLAYDEIKAETKWEIEDKHKKQRKKAAKIQAKGGSAVDVDEDGVPIHGGDLESNKKGMNAEIRDVTCCTPTCVCLQGVCCWRPKVDKLDYVAERIDETMQRMTKLEGKMKPTPSVVVTFRTRDAAVKASSTVFTRKRARWFSTPAPDFDDLRWKSFELSHRERNIRYGIILGFTVILGIIFFIPTTFAQGLANLSTLAKIPGFNWITPLTQRYKKATSFIEGILPSLVLTIAFVIAKLILKKVVLVEGYFTRSNEFRSFSSKYFYLLILNIFLASIAAGTFITLFNSVRDLVEDPLSIIRLLAQRLPTQVNFFINYMAVNSVITNLLPLLQPFRLLLRMFCKYHGKGKTYAQRNWLRQFNWVHYHEEYPIQMLYFAITIAYSSLAPLIVPFSLIFFAIKYFVGQYHSLYVFKRRMESYGKYWPSVFNRLCAGVILYQALMTGIFSLQRYVAGIVVCAILLATTVIYAIAVNMYYGPELAQHAVEVHPEYMKPDNANLAVLAQHYRDPLRDWEIVKDNDWVEGVWFNSRDRLRQLQLSISQPEYYQQLQDVRMGFTNFTDSINMLVNQEPDAELPDINEDPLHPSIPIESPARHRNHSKKHKKHRSPSQDMMLAATSSNEMPLEPMSSSIGAPKAKKAKATSPTLLSPAHDSTETSDNTDTDDAESSHSKSPSSSTSEVSDSESE